jgi:formiminoglutamase
MTNFIFKPATQDLLLQFTTKRIGETKIGEKIELSSSLKEAKYVLIGIEENLGPQANGGFSGAENAFNAFLKRFLNMQSNRFLTGNELAFIGSIQQTTDFKNIETAKSAITELDLLVETVLKPYIHQGLIPIVIGGGHNNAYPIIKTISEAANKAIDVINLDPHADCRALEGRHSGNSFSYAKENGYINHYSVLGLHKNYNSTFILDYLEYNNFYYTFFDDYILNPSQFDMDLTKTFLSISKERKFGIELDLDAIAFTPSSAFTPSGFNSLEARKYIKTLSKHSNCCYLHLPEAAPTNETEEKITGKLIAYLVADFIQENLTT